MVHPDWRNLFQRGKSSGLLGNIDQAAFLKTPLVLRSHKSDYCQLSWYIDEVLFIFITRKNVLDLPI